MARYDFKVVAEGHIEAKHDVEAREFLEAVQHYADINAEDVTVEIEVKPAD